MRLDLVGDELDQVDSIWGRTRWGRTRHGAKPAATLVRLRTNLNLSLQNTFQHTETTALKIIVLLPSRFYKYTVGKIRKIYQAFKYLAP